MYVKHLVKLAPGKGSIGFPGGTSGKERTGLPMQETEETWFDPWVGKITLRRAWQPTPVLPGESHGQGSLAGSSSVGLQRGRYN